jgi:hypothetical protein
LSSRGSWWIFKDPPPLATETDEEGLAAVREYSHLLGADSSSYTVYWQGEWWGVRRSAERLAQLGVQLELAEPRRIDECLAGEHPRMRDLRDSPQLFRERRGINGAMTALEAARRILAASLCASFRVYTSPDPLSRADTKLVMASLCAYID